MLLQSAELPIIYISAVFIKTDGDRMLFQRRRGDKRGVYSPFGGHQEGDEEPWAVLSREMSEEFAASLCALIMSGITGEIQRYCVEAESVTNVITVWFSLVSEENLSTFIPSLNKYVHEDEAEIFDPSAIQKLIKEEPTAFFAGTIPLLRMFDQTRSIVDNSCD